MNLPLITPRVLRPAGRDAVICALLLSFMLTGCTPKSPVSGGTPVDGALLDEVSAEVFAPGTVYDPADPLPLAEDEVIWTAGGTVCHSFADCRYLRGASGVFCGTREQALREGKEKMCSVCHERAERKESDYAEIQDPARG